MYGPDYTSESGDYFMAATWNTSEYRDQEGKLTCALNEDDNLPFSLCSRMNECNEHGATRLMLRGYGKKHFYGLCPFV